MNRVVAVAGAVRVQPDLYHPLGNQVKRHLAPKCSHRGEVCAVHGKGARVTRWMCPPCLADVPTMPGPCACACRRVWLNFRCCRDTTVSPGFAEYAIS